MILVSSGSRRFVVEFRFCVVDRDIVVFVIVLGGFWFLFIVKEGEGRWEVGGGFVVLW